MVLTQGVPCCLCFDLCCRTEKTEKCINIYECGQLQMYPIMLSTDNMSGGVNFIGVRGYFKFYWFFGY